MSKDSKNTKKGDVKIVEGNTETDAAEETVELTPEQQQEAKTFYFERRRQYHDGAANAGAAVWLVSFTDVIALMLTFFVLLYAMSDPVQQKWDYKMGITSVNVAKYSGPQNLAGNQEDVNINRLSFRQAKNLDYAQAVLQETLSENESGSIINITRTRDALHLSFVDTMFTADNGEFSDEMQQLLRRLGPVLNNLDNSLVIAGHAEADEQEDVFAQTQAFAKALMDADYKKPLALSMDVAVSGEWVDLVLRPHDGRRITQ